MSLNKEDVWADLRYALDELERSPSDIHSRLTEAAELDAQPEDEFFNRLLQIGLLSIAYSKAKLRADTRIAHEAIEKGLKTILIDSGLSEGQVRSSGHELHRLLEDVQRHSPTTFNELERCFDRIIDLIERVTPFRHNTNIVDHFQKHGKQEVLVATRYASLEGGNNTDGGMIGLVYTEMISALLSLIFGWTPRDVDSRLEDETRKAILAESIHDAAWDAAEWLSRGPVHPRLEVIENQARNRVLRAAVRRCARESKDRGIQYWARMLRHKLIDAKRTARAERRSRGAD